MACVATRVQAPSQAISGEVVNVVVLDLRIAAGARMRDSTSSVMR